MADYQGSIKTPTYNLAAIKLQGNRAISTKINKYMRMDVKDFYLNTKMFHLKWIHISTQTTPK